MDVPRSIPARLPPQFTFIPLFSLLNFMSAIIDNLWKINVQLPHVVPNRYVSPPVTATATAPLPLVELLRGHGFVFVCLRFVVRLAALPPASLARWPCAPLSVPGILMLFVESAAAMAGSDSNNAAGRRSEPDSFSAIYNIHAFTGATYDIPRSSSGRGLSRLF